MTLRAHNMWPWPAVMLALVTYGMSPAKADDAAASKPAPEVVVPVPTTRRATFREEPSLYWGLAYALGMPLLESADFSGRFSPRGASMELRYSLSRHLSLGASVAWQRFASTGSDEAQLLDLTIPPTQRRRVDVVPILFAPRVYMLDGDVHPYAAVGLGALFSERRLKTDAIESRLPGWHFALAPELGALWRVRDSYLSLGGRFVYAAPSPDRPSESYVSVLLGLVDG